MRTIYEVDISDAVHLHNGVNPEATREFYNLERLWADAKISAWPNEADA